MNAPEIIYAGEEMAWPEPQYTVQQINKAGNIIGRSSDEAWEKWEGKEWETFRDALVVVNNWRGAHAYPLNTFQVTLRGVARRLDNDAVIAQRIKRLVSIMSKLGRFRKMKLSQMQDLGGCRAILKDVSMVEDVRHHYLHKSSIKHRLASVDDYITSPKASGYRGVHLVYKYFSNSQKQMYNDMKIEMQIRSQYQHAWATAVETVDLFSGQALKSSLGSEEWKRFFALMGSAIALREGRSLVPETPTSRRELISELRKYADELQVATRLREYGKVVQSLATSSEGAYFFLLELDAKRGTLSVSGFQPSEAIEAERKYAEAEQLAKQKEGTDAVLVSVDSVNALARAYPNYFADTRLFLELMNQAISGKSRGIRVSTKIIPTTTDDVSVDAAF